MDAFGASYSCFYSYSLELGGVMGLQEYMNIVLFTIVGIIIIMAILYYRMYKAKRNGTMKPIQLIEFSSGEMIHELRGKYKNWQIGSLESLRSIDEYIEEKIRIYSPENLLKDKELVFRLGSFVGEVIKNKKGYHWCVLLNETYMVKSNVSIFPFEKIKKRIENGMSDSIYDYGKCL